MSAQSPLEAPQVKPYQDYSREQKAEVLAILEANSGNLKRTAAETGIDHSTIRYWYENRDRFRELQPQKIIDLASKAESNAHLLADSIATHDLDTASLSQKATAYGVMIDKMQLLRGLPTSITETVERQDMTIILQSALSDAIDVTPTDTDS
jgi:transposase-like protein